MQPHDAVWRPGLRSKKYRTQARRGMGSTLLPLFVGQQGLVANLVTQLMILRPDANGGLALVGGAQTSEQGWSFAQFPTGVDDGEAVRHHIGKAGKVCIGVRQRPCEPRLKKVMQFANFRFALFNHHRFPVIYNSPCAKPRAA